ncbi:hypothetical protein KCU79_g7555, partial [Aureobasidium melanogenum]
MVQKHGKPSRIVRYWLPITICILSSSTILRYPVKLQSRNLTWIQEFGHTIRNFCINWCIKHTRKIIQMIRHDNATFALQTISGTWNQVLGSQ